MPGIRADLRRTDPRAAFDAYYRNAIQRMERAALIATDRAATRAKTRLRGQMSAAGLGRLGNAIDSTSDLKRGVSVHRFGAEGFSASGGLFIRSHSERTRGAIRAYTEGADILPRRGRWLWYPAPEAPRLVGSGKTRQRLTPEVYRQMGEPMGPLILLRSVNGHPLLAVRNVGVSEAGARGGKARSLTKGGQPRRGDRLKALVVLFIGIPRTSRAARVDVPALMRELAAELPALWRQAMAGGGRR